MINLTYAQIIEKVIKEANISKEELEIRIDKKLKDLSDLVSREGAAHIVANELDVKLFSPLPTTLKIRDLMAGMNSVNVLGKVLTIYPTREYKKESRSGRVASILIGDETGTTRMVIWDENIIQKLKELKEEDIVKISNTYCKDNNGYKEIHLGNKSQLIINPKDEFIKEVNIKQILPRRHIKDLTENENAKLFGTIVQLFEPRFYEICPECGKRVKLNEQNYVCEEHSKVSPKLVPVINMFFDDGTANIRVVCFREIVEALLNLNLDSILKLKDNPEGFEKLKKDILGKQLVIEGRTVNNTFFNNLEFIARNIIEPTPLEINEILG